MTEVPLETVRVLRVPRERVSPKARTLWFAGAIGNVLFCAAVVAGLDWLDWLWWSPPWWAWLLYAVAAAAYVVAMPTIRYRTHRWETTDTAVYTQSGWLSVERSIAPMSRVQTVDYQQGPLERLVGIATVTVNTASAAGALGINGLAKPVAERVVEELTRRAEVEQDDAT